MQKLGPSLKFSFSHLVVKLHCFVLFCFVRALCINWLWVCLSFIFLCEQMLNCVYDIFFSGHVSCFIPSLFDYGLKVHALLKACVCKKELCNLTTSSFEISISNPLQKIPHVYRYTYKYHVPKTPLILPQFCMLIHVWIPEEEILLCTVNNTQLCKVSDVLNKMYVFTDWSFLVFFLQPCCEILGVDNWTWNTIYIQLLVIESIFVWIAQ